MSQRQSPGTEKDHISKSNSKDRVRPCILSLSNQLAEIKAQWETPFFKSQTSYKNTTYIIHYFTQLEPYSLKVGVKLRVRVPSPNFCMHPLSLFGLRKRETVKWFESCIDHMFVYFLDLTSWGSYTPGTKI